MKIKNQHYLMNATFSAIVLVQIHDRWESLKHLVDSLSSAWQIESTLIIFSGDCFSTLIDKIIEAVDFAPYIKMYYPLTPEVFTSEFKRTILNYVASHLVKISPPKVLTHKIFSGITAWDNLTRLIVSCDVNPESLHHYKQIRKFSLSLIKLHWLWKMNAIFDPTAFIHLKIDNLEILSSDSFFPKIKKFRFTSFMGPVLMLEDDNVVLPDFLYVIHKIYSIKHLNFGRTKNNILRQQELYSLNSLPLRIPRRKGSVFKLINSMLSLGMHSDFKILSKCHTEDTLFVVINKRPYNFRNIGMVWNKYLWQSIIRNNINRFCQFSDYNWDWSLINIIKNIPFINESTGVFAVVSSPPRVLHQG
ncbi:unnamed protein product [Gordionus sp. m RMFG-2023]|uniref:alpha-1,6-mannosyl-glycoprotein 2-beta-N-acetylglucosaminyltransferase-like n=1 Tax=Gordionus sp. m RMFG-2023 TaxID=3053472 RepID=UPI0030E3A917